MGGKGFKKEQETLVKGPHYIEMYSTCSNEYLKCTGEENQSKRK